MNHEPPAKFLSAANQPQQNLRLQSESMLAPQGHFSGQSERVITAADVIRAKRKLYDVSGIGESGIAYAQRDCR